MDELMLKGLSVSQGIACGSVLLINNTAPHHLTERAVMPAEVAQEIECMHRAVDKSKQQLTAIIENGTAAKDILEAHILMLADPALLSQVENCITERLVPAEQAVRQVTGEFAAMMRSLDDEYMRERAADIEDAGKRIINNLLGYGNAVLQAGERAIVVAHDLIPSETAELNAEQVLALVVGRGGKTSHTAIIAKTLGIPAVTGVAKLMEMVRAGDYLVVDGNKGEIIINPASDTRERYQAESNNFTVKMQQLLTATASVTLDGHPFELAANIGNAADVKLVERYDAQGIGLFRTEFLYLDREAPPSEEEQFCIIKRL